LRVPPTSRGAAATSRRRETWRISRLRGSDGQGMVELVLILPLLVTLIFMVIQLGLTFSNYMRVTDIARVAARAAAVARFSGVSACQAAATAADNAAGSLAIGRPTCSGGANPGDPFSVTVSLPWKISLPLLPFSWSGDLKSTSTDRLE
jgi:Flp pilus assembly protein TadG